MTEILFQTPLACVWLKKAPGANTHGACNIRQQQKMDAVHLLPKTRSLFYHPDYTVGPGVSPSQPPKRVADFTASREFHPAPKNIVVIQFSKSHYISCGGLCKPKLYDAVD
jgi:hypothetical protein